MASRDTARKNGNLKHYKLMQNCTKSLVKQDKVQGVMNRLKKNPGPQSSWKEARTLLGNKQKSKLPECTTNANPSTTAEYQISNLPMKLTEKDLSNHIALVHTSNKKAFKFRYVTAGDVTRIVRNLKNTEAIGVDCISTEVLKKGINVLASPIARICNISMSVTCCLRRGPGRV